MCDNKKDCPLFVNLMMPVFDWLEEHADNWIKEYGPMFSFGAYVCLKLNKLLCDLVVAGSTFTNDNATKDRAIGAFDLEPCYKAAAAIIGWLNRRL